MPGGKLGEGVVRFRLGIHANAPGDARSLSRLLGPLQLMARQDPRLELVLPLRAPDNAGWDMDWHFMSGVDAVLLLDPYTEGDMRRVALANACGTPVWSDYVDDLTNVRPSNPVFLSYADRKQVRKNIAQVMRGSAITTTTTETLRAVLPFSDQVLVIPESCRWPRSDSPRKQVITWRGFGSHNEDLESVLPQLRDLAHLPQFCNWDWVFIGEPYWKVFDDLIPRERLVYVPGMTPYDLMNRWGGMCPFIHIAPLADNAFNHAKTPLAWLEATAVGAAVLAPDFPEWRIPGITNYRTPADFGVQLRRLMDDWTGGALHPQVKVSRKEIYPTRTTELVNELRWEVVRKLAGLRANAAVGAGKE